MTRYRVLFGLFTAAMMMLCATGIEFVNGLSPVPAYDICIYKISTGKITRVAKTSNIYNYDVFGDRIFFTHDDFYIHTISKNVTSKTKLNISFENRNEITIFDSNMIYERLIGDNYDVFLYDFSTKEERVVLEDKSRHPYLTMYGDKIIWADNRTSDGIGGALTDWNLYLYNLTSEETVQLTTDIHVQFRPALYEDLVVFENNSADIRGIMGAVGTIELLDLTNNTTRQIAAGTEPDIYGQNVVFLNNSKIMLYNISNGLDAIAIDPSHYQHHQPRIYGDIVIWKEQTDGFGSSSVSPFCIPIAAICLTSAIAAVIIPLALVFYHKRAQPVYDPYRPYQP